MGLDFWDSQAIHFGIVTQCSTFYVAARFPASSLPTFRLTHVASCNLPPLNPLNNAREDGAATLYPTRGPGQARLSPSASLGSVPVDAGAGGDVRLVRRSTIGDGAAARGPAPLGPAPPGPAPGPGPDPASGGGDGGGANSGGGGGGGADGGGKHSFKPVSQTHEWKTISAGLQRFGFAVTFGASAVVVFAILWVLSVPWVAWCLLRDNPVVSASHTTSESI